MKKIFITLCALFCIVGCSCKKDIQVTLKHETLPTVENSSTYLYEEYSILSYELSSTEEYDKKINNKDSFLLFVYREMCFGCQMLSPAIGDYLKENEKAVIYTMNISNIDSKHALNKDENIVNTPYLILIDEGHIAYKEIMPIENDSKAKAKTWFYDWMKKHVVWEE